METENKIKELEDELEKTRKELNETKEHLNETKEHLNETKEHLNETKEHLKKYTAPSRSKSYYENHKKEIIKRVKEYKQNTNYTYEVSPEKRKEYNKTAYQKKKDQKEPI
jgi:hypothetical protein